MRFAHDCATSLLYFKAFLENSRESGFIEGLEDVISQGGNNIHLQLHRKLTPLIVRIREKIRQSEFGQPAVSDSTGGVDDGKRNGRIVIAEGVVYRIAVFGDFDSRKQGLIESELAGTGIELVFFPNEKDVRGTYPDCDGVAIFRGSSSVSGGLPHSSAARSYYEQHHYPIMVRGISRNPARVAGDLIEFRNQLAYS